MVLKPVTVSVEAPCLVSAPLMQRLSPPMVRSGAVAATVTDAGRSTSVTFTVLAWARWSNTTASPVTKPVSLPSASTKLNVV